MVDSDERRKDEKSFTTGAYIYTRYIHDVFVRECSFPVLLVAGRGVRLPALSVSRFQPIARRLCAAAGRNIFPPSCRCSPLAGGVAAFGVV